MKISLTVKWPWNLQNLYPQNHCVWYVQYYAWKTNISVSTNFCNYVYSVITEIHIKNLENINYLHDREKTACLIDHCITPYLQLLLIWKQQLLPVMSNTMSIAIITIMAPTFLSRIYSFQLPTAASLDSKNISFHLMPLLQQW